MQHVICVKWSADNKYILSGSDEMNIRLWKANTAEKLIFSASSNFMFLAACCLLAASCEPMNSCIFLSCQRSTVYCTSVLILFYELAASLDTAMAQGPTQQG